MEAHTHTLNRAEFEPIRVEITLTSNEDALALIDALLSGPDAARIKSIADRIYMPPIDAQKISVAFIEINNLAQKIEEEIYLPQQKSRTP
jgi:hypothetical protein